MPLTIPILDDRNYDDLLAEALARIPVHTPEWTNFNKSDPGVTLLEVFAFLTENLLYRSNQIPERNRRKFLSLLGLPLHPAASAHGLVAFANERPQPQTITLGSGLEVRAGKVPFHTERGLDVLPIEARVFYKKTLAPERARALQSQYAPLYRSFGQVSLYETLPFAAGDLTPVNLSDTADGYLWVALLARPKDKGRLDEVRAAVAGKVLSLGIVPDAGDGGRDLRPGESAQGGDAPTLEFALPVAGALPRTAAGRQARYRPLDARTNVDLLTNVGIAQVALPATAAELTRWDLEPTEDGVAAFPPALQDTNLDERLLTWVRIGALGGAQQSARLVWAGINAATVAQRASMSGEVLPDGSGEPDQSMMLSKTPVIPGSVRLSVTRQLGDRQVTETWKETGDLATAGAEVPVSETRARSLAATARGAASGKVFTLDPESGELRFGDGMRGARPPRGARLRVDYDYGVGREGNVNAGSINGGPDLPVGLKVGNPVPTWGGAEAETVEEGEKQVSRYVQHRDRMVTASDFATIARRTPGVDIARVEVVPLFNPALGATEPGDAPGAVTLVVIPRYDAAQPEAPNPDRAFLDAICRHVDERRLITTEIFLRGPVYKPIWVTAGITVKAGWSQAEVREEVRRALSRFLSPLPQGVSGAVDHNGSPFADAHEGWPLAKEVVDRELWAVASRVPGVVMVNSLELAEEGQGARPSLAMRGLELPRLAGVAVQVGVATPLDELRGAIPAENPDGPTSVPAPIVPEDC
jgi:hypothetical protein